MGSGSGSSPCSWHEGEPTYPTRGQAIRAAVREITRRLEDPRLGESKEAPGVRNWLDRHVDVEGWTDERDDERAPGTLALAAAAYALDAGHSLDCFVVDDADHPEPLFWPLSSDWWKPGTPRRGLVKAASLILAEIERIDRTASATNDQEADS
jgi:hypothetical protein